MSLDTPLPQFCSPAVSCGLFPCLSVFCSFFPANLCSFSVPSVFRFCFFFFLVKLFSSITSALCFVSIEVFCKSYRLVLKRLGLLLPLMGPASVPSDVQMRLHEPLNPFGPVCWQLVHYSTLQSIARWLYCSHAKSWPQQVCTFVYFSVQFCCTFAVLCNLLHANYTL